MVSEYGNNLYKSFETKTGVEFHLIVLFYKFTGINGSYFDVIILRNMHIYSEIENQHHIYIYITKERIDR